MSLPRVETISAIEEDGRSATLLAIHFGHGMPIAGLVLLVSGVQRLAVAELFQVATLQKSALSLAIEAYDHAALAITTAPKGTP